MELADGNEPLPRLLGDAAVEKFLGLPIREKPLTDSEYVGRIRRRCARSRGVGKWLLLLSAVLGIGTLYLACEILPVLLQIAGLQVPIGLAIGGAIGVMLGFVAQHLGGMVRAALIVFKGDRTAELLLKYHDALVELARLEKQSSDVPQQDTPAGAARN
jgi:fumarate reductase subunit D